MISSRRLANHQLTISTSSDSFIALANLGFLSQPGFWNEAAVVGTDNGRYRTVTYG